METEGRASGTHGDGRARHTPAAAAGGGEMERTTTHKAFSGYRRILWPTDLSRLARTALPHALQLVAGSKGELVIVHVLPTVAAYLSPEMAGRAWDQIDRANRAIGQRKLDRMTQAIKAEHP